MPIALDIHEKFHGPHGLIAGSTGSGKSEFIITYILSLAINYNPYDVAFILIDYKGGGLAGAFQKREVKLPHLVGTITNIDTVGLQRSLASIQSELRRRQVIFNQTRNKIDEGTIDIYKYQKLYHEGVVTEPVPHLLIICDEFAELKQQQPDFMDELISVARIGRSLGVHLILATQKPAGIVNDQIRSNSKFGICLKVQDRQDSNDVIKRPDAADLKQAGQFYMQVGNNEYFVLGQSGWSGAPYIPSDVTKKKVDNSVKIISNIGTVIKEASNAVQQQGNNEGEQLTNIVRYLYELANQENIQAKQLWLENIPENIYIKQIREKYNVTAKKNVIDPVIGEYDDPSNQRQGIVELKLSSEGNAIVFGNAESGKETLLSTAVYDIMTTHTAEEAQIYLLDFGSESLKIFKDSPHVGDVIFMNDVEKIQRLFEMLQKEIRDRIAVLSDYNGDYNLYLNTGDKPMPMIVVMINNYEAFAENYEDEYDDILLTLTREGLKCGVVFVITASASHDIRYRLSQNFKQKIVLQLNNDDEYSNILDGVRKKRPSHMFGRGLISMEDIYEFQTAKICEPGQWNAHIKEKIEELKQTNKIFAKEIKILPELLTIDMVRDELKSIKNVPIGIAKKNLNFVKYDFTKDIINIITSKNMETSVEYTLHIMEALAKIQDVNVIVFDAERVIQTQNNNINDVFNKFVSQIDENSQPSNKHTLGIIIGIDKFLSDLEDQSAFAQMLKKVQELGKYSFIVVENVAKLKNHQYDDWCKSYASNESGIWIGNGISDQYVINVQATRKEIVNNCSNSFGYYIKQGKPTYMKLLGMKEGEEDE